jgi:cytochrome P450 family 710 subfamily A protein
MRTHARTHPQVLADVKEADEQGLPHPFYSGNDKMADSVMDFLFASQDASSASLTWAVTLMAEHPEVGGAPKLSRAISRQLQLVCYPRMQAVHRQSAHRDQCLNPTPLPPPRMHPQVLARVREEQERFRPDLDAPITFEQLTDMKYTRQCVKEILRFRPPAPMVPQVRAACRCCVPARSSIIAHRSSIIIS